MLVSVFEVSLILAFFPLPEHCGTAAQTFLVNSLLECHQTSRDVGGT